MNICLTIQESKTTYHDGKGAPHEQFQMKKFNAKKSSVSLDTYLFIIGLSILLIIFSNVFVVTYLWINIILLLISPLWVLYDYFWGEFVWEITIDNEHQCLTVLFKRNNGRRQREIKYLFPEIEFKFEYENISRSGTMPILSFYRGKFRTAKLIMHADWEESVVKEVIEELKVNGIKGKVAKTNVANTNDFEYFN
jgi:hypothetical protein